MPSDMFSLAASTFCGITSGISNSERASFNFDINFFAVFEFVYVSFSLKFVIIGSTFLDLILAVYDILFYCFGTHLYRLDKDKKTYISSDMSQTICDTRMR
jgi:hypothetical protein